MNVPNSGRDILPTPIKGDVFIPITNQETDIKVDIAIFFGLDFHPTHYPPAIALRIIQKSPLESVLCGKTVNGTRDLLMAGDDEDDGSRITTPKSKLTP